MNILNYLNVLDYDKDGVPDGCDECPNTYGNGEKGCTCNPIMAERYELEAEHLRKEAESCNIGEGILTGVSLGEAILAIGLGVGGFIIGGPPGAVAATTIFTTVTGIAGAASGYEAYQEGNKEDEYIAKAETLENDATQLENEADIWERGCRND